MTAPPGRKGATSFVIEQRCVEIPLAATETMITCITVQWTIHPQVPMTAIKVWRHVAAFAREHQGIKLNDQERSIRAVSKNWKLTNGI